MRMRLLTAACVAYGFCILPSSLKAADLAFERTGVNSDRIEAFSSYDVITNFGYTAHDDNAAVDDLFAASGVGLNDSWSNTWFGSLFYGNLFTQEVSCAFNLPGGPVANLSVGHVIDLAHTLELIPHSSGPAATTYGMATLAALRELEITSPTSAYGPADPLTVTLESDVYYGFTLTGGQNATLYFGTITSYKRNGFTIANVGIGRGYVYGVANDVYYDFPLDPDIDTYNLVVEHEARVGDIVKMEAWSWCEVRESTLTANTYGNIAGQADWIYSIAVEAD